MIKHPCIGRDELRTLAVFGGPRRFPPSDRNCPRPILVEFDACGGQHTLGTQASVKRVLKRRWKFLPPLLWRLPKAHAWAATVLVDELDASGL